LVQVGKGDDGDRRFLLGPRRAVEAVRGSQTLVESPSIEGLGDSEETLADDGFECLFRRSGHALDGKLLGLSLNRIVPFGFLRSNFELRFSSSPGCANAARLGRK